MTEAPLCEPWIYLAFLLWVRGKVEGTFLAFHVVAEDKKESRIVDKDLRGPRMIMHHSRHVMIVMSLTR